MLLFFAFCLKCAPLQPNLHKVVTLVKLTGCNFVIQIALTIMLAWFSCCMPKSQAHAESYRVATTLSGQRVLVNNVYYELLYCILVKLHYICKRI